VAEARPPASDRGRVWAAGHAPCWYRAAHASRVASIVRPPNAENCALPARRNGELRRGERHCKTQVGPSVMSCLTWTSQPPRRVRNRVQCSRLSEKPLAVCPTRVLAVQPFSAGLESREARFDVHAFVRFFSRFSSQCICPMRSSVFASTSATRALAVASFASTSARLARSARYSARVISFGFRDGRPP
jgi:hypothetical protein